MAKWEIRTKADYDKAAKAIQGKLDRLSKALVNAPLQAIADIALDCLSRAVQRAPVKLGDLRASGFVEVNSVSYASVSKEGAVTLNQSFTLDGKITHVVAKIGFTAKYAWVQHEHMEFEHPEGGQAKYLESVVVESSERWKTYVKKKIAEALQEVADE